MKPSWILSLLIVTLALPNATVGAGGQEEAAALLEAPAGQAVLDIPPGTDDRGAAPALEAGAYLSALALAGEADAEVQEEALWEESQRSANPQEAFLQEVLDRWQAFRPVLNQSLQRLGDQTRDGVTVGEADAMLLASHFLVRAEGDHMLAGRLVSGSSSDSKYTQTHEQRFLLLRPLAIAQHNVDAAEHLMDVAQPGGARIDLHAIDATVEARGGAGAQHWILPEHGMLHRLARHVQASESSADEPFQERGSYPTPAEMQSAVQGLDAARATWPDWLPSVRAAAVSTDVHWWIDRVGSDYDEQQWGPLFQILNGYILGATYEGQIIQQGAPEESLVDRISWTWVGAVAGALLLAGLVFLVVRRRRSSGTHGLAALATVAMMALLLPAMQAPTAAAQATAEDPLETVVPLTAPDHIGGWGGMTRAPDGRIHFAWAACQEETDGCRDIWTRWYDPDTGSWGEPQKWYDGTRNATSPILLVGADTTHLVWNEATAQGPWTVKSCQVVGGTCTGVTDHGTDGADKGNVQAALGPDGRLRIVWQEVFSDQWHVLFRQQDSEGWQDPIHFPPQENVMYQHLPSLAVDRDGRSHVAWQERVGGTSFSTIWYTTVEPDGQAAAMAEQIHAPGAHGHTQPTLAAQSDGTIGMVFNLRRETYFQEKDPGDADWSTPVNVSRTESGSQQSALQLLPQQDGWTVLWRTGTTGQMGLVAAERVDGFWLQPHTVLDGPYSELILRPSGAHDQAGIHLAWTGKTTDAPEVQMHYRILASDGEDLPPPTVDRLVPPPSGWTNTTQPTMRVHFSSSAPLDLDQSSLTVDGIGVDLHLRTVHGIQFLEAQATLDEEGTHEAELELVDRQGGSVREDWAFGLDTQPPDLDVTWSVGGHAVEQPEGWHAEPVAVALDTADSGGSPTRIEVSMDDGVTYVHPSEVGLDANDGAFLLPEGQQMHLRFRARDAAGNVDAAPAYRVGWDQTPPDIQFANDRWTRDAPDVRFLANQTAPGSPVTVQATLDASGDQDVNWTADLADGHIALDGLRPGDHTVVLVAQDAAGNSMEPVRVQVGVDPDPPRVTLDNTSLETVDNVSGLAALVVEHAGQRLLETGLDATPTHRVEIPWPPGASSVRATVEDVAGNTWTGRLDLAAGALQDATEEAGGAQDVGAASDSDDRGLGVPGPAAGIALFALAAAAVCRRRRA